MSAAGGVQAARPMNTDDARVVDDKSCQLETWVKHIEGRNEFWAQPACNFSGNLELTVGAAWMRHSGDKQRGAELVQGKTLFKQLQTNGWGWGLAMGLSHDPRSGAGGGHDTYAYVPVSISLADDKVVLHTNVGWLREQDTRRNRMTWGVGSETQLSQRNWLIAEFYGQGTGRPLYQVGLRHWLVPERMQIDTTYGNRLGGAGGHWVSIGVRLLSPPFLP